MSNAVNHPEHYTSHPSGVECIRIVEHFGFNIGNAVKYLWRAGLKSKNPIEDLQKAAWYVGREIFRIDPGATAFPVADTGPSELEAAVILAARRYTEADRTGSIAPFAEIPARYASLVAAVHALEADEQGKGWRK